ncbi:protein of unknown function [Terribacillus halophilus]|uniref:DUF3784 domain-containing protein n=1 Tax=Terribacillus halophilus TaxID=361279 RepID=A0A1G6KHN2_9BACI|nr:DUF3784 domain-containing protein [Terribacillus halophilus]SDC30483.1 protein of unknown function [Terribacillus halophilus]
MGGAIASFVMFILFLIFAIFLSKGKGAFLLAGYNTMSDRDKDQYDEVALCKFMAKIMYGFSFSVLLYVLSALFESDVLSTIGLIYC